MTDAPAGAGRRPVRRNLGSGAYSRHHNLRFHIHICLLSGSTAGEYWMAIIILEFLLCISVCSLGMQVKWQVERQIVKPTGILNKL